MYRDYCEVVVCMCGLTNNYECVLYGVISVRIGWCVVVCGDVCVSVFV